MDGLSEITYQDGGMGLKKLGHQQLIVAQNASFRPRYSAVRHIYIVNGNIAEFKSTIRTTSSGNLHFVLINLLFNGYTGTPDAEYGINGRETGSVEQNNNVDSNEQSKNGNHALIVYCYLIHSHPASL
jgi:hypothetical protein